MVTEVYIEEYEDLPQPKVRIRRTPKTSPMRVFWATAEHIARLKAECLEKRMQEFSFNRFY